MGRQGNDPLDHVSELFDTDTCTWDVELVKRNFLAPDAEAILNIPIRQGGGDDFLAWAFERSGNYTVKSVYRALVTQKERASLEEGRATETSEEDTQLWKSLWKLNAIPKFRVFWWRVLRGILPDEVTLNYRHIAEIRRCKVCLAMDENLEHALIHCSHAKCFWEEAYAWFGLRLPRLHPDSWARDITCDPRFTNDDRAKITTIMWSIWHSRNRIKHGEEGRNPTATIRATKEAIALLHLPRRDVMILPGFGWRPPDEGVVKITTDGALNFADGRGGAGGVARSSSALLGAWCKPYLGISDPLIMEGLSLRDGVRFASLRGFSHVVMETDCLEMVTLWNTRHNSRSIVAPLLLEIGELCNNFTLFVIQHVNRPANLPAHLCAKRACILNVTESWLEETPSFLVTSLLADCPKMLS